MDANERAIERETELRRKSLDSALSYDLRHYLRETLDGDLPAAVIVKNAEIFLDFLQGRTHPPSPPCDALPLEASHKTIHSSGA